MGHFTKHMIEGHFIKFYKIVVVMVTGLGEVF